MRSHFEKGAFEHARHTKANRLLRSRRCLTLSECYSLGIYSPELDRVRDPRNGEHVSRNAIIDAMRI